MIVPLLSVAALSPGHRRLLLQELKAIAGHLLAMWNLESLLPPQLVVFLMDLRSRAGGEVAGSVLGHERVQDAIVLAAQEGRLPVLTFPLPIEPAVELVQVCVPELLDSVLNRPPDRMALVIVDADDSSVAMMIDRVPHAGSA